MTKRGETRQQPVSLDREESAPEQWLRTIQFSGFTALMLALVILAVIVLAPNLRILIEQQQTIAALNESVADTRESVDELTEDKARWDDPAYIEAQARERLFYVYPGEVSYLVVGSNDQHTTENGQPISTEIQTTQVDWMHGLLSSIVSSGLTEQPPAELVGPELGGTN
ncbi:MAG: FtsB family cell division protein [Rhodoglobus sp.]